MDINRLTQKAQEAISSAQTKAARYGHQQVDVEHLLASLLEQEGGLATSIFTKAEINVDNLKRRVEQEFERMPKVSGPGGAPDQIFITGRLNRLLAEAEDEANKLKDEYVSIEHLLLAMTDDGGAAVSSRSLGSRGKNWRRRSRGYAATSGSPRRIRRRPTKLLENMAATSPNSPLKASSTR